VSVKLKLAEVWLVGLLGLLVIDGGAGAVVSIVNAVLAGEVDGV
jgi:hypothetical protein